MTWDCGHEAARLRTCQRLLLEKVFECLASVVWSRWSRRNGGWPLTFLRIRGRRGIFLDGGAKFVKSALILGVLRRDPFRNRLRALELGGAIEKAALFTTVQSKPALGTVSCRVEAGR